VRVLSPNGSQAIGTGGRRKAEKMAEPAVG